MTGFDIGVLIVVGVTAASGFMRGFVHEILSLAAWVVAVLAIHYLHTPLTEQVIPFTGDQFGSAAVLAFALLLLVPYFIIKMLARRMGAMSRDSVLGPIDRVIGFGFGGIKGLLIIVMGFSIIVLGFDTLRGVGGRPPWMTLARTYPFVNAGSEALVKIIAERRSEAAKAEQERLDRQ
ncbi:CvpA family protein [Novosphingobium sp. TH158]|uniref:CvpA family protein n=1 Tax=Novosphingobium sp. TH158 TaxID=2067455 RepID=UPI000C7C7723|nr:CvpA family protein [Novosphingobium sp. TH158]PLK25888.1 colicin V production protein [Novosphingobium sp. TH158]